MLSGRQPAKRGGVSAALRAMVSFSVMTAAIARNGGKLKGQVAVVTGSAKRLGRAVAMRLAEEGADIVIHYRSSAGDAQSAVTEIEKAGRRGYAIADCASPAEER